MRQIADAQSPFVVGLSADIRGRLRELEQEKQRLRRALAILERPLPRPAANGKPGRLSAREGLVRRVLHAIEENPGTRGSVLALSERQDAVKIKELLDELCAEGFVEEDGLGWRIRSDPTAI